MLNQKIVFQDPSRITKLLRFFLQGCLVFTTLSIIANYTAYNFFTDVSNGLFSNSQVIDDLREVHDNRQGLINFLYSFVLMGTGLTFALWIYQANKNCRALGAKSMQFTPGWCIGWFLIPVLQMWMPYKAIKEIWKSSSDANHWAMVDSSAVMKLWWFCYLLSGLFECLAVRAMLKADEMSEIINATNFMIVKNLLSYPLCISAMIMINEIYNRQMSQRDLRMGKNKAISAVS